MKDFERYKEALMYLAIVIVIAVLCFKQVQPKIVSTINLFGEVKTQSEAAQGIAQQLSTAKQKAERKKKLRMLDDITKKIYQPNGAVTDSESTFALLLDDIIEITRKNHIKTHSIQSTLDPEDDVFIKGDKAHYSANKLDMKMISDYTDFKGFLEDLYKYPYLLNINNIEIYPYSKNKRILLINLSITLYAAKSEEEAAEANTEKENKEGGEEQPQEQPQEQSQEQPQEQPQENNEEQPPTP